MSIFNYLKYEIPLKITWQVITFITQLRNLNLCLSYMLINLLSTPTNTQLKRIKTHVLQPSYILVFYRAWSPNGKTSTKGLLHSFHRKHSSLKGQLNFSDVLFWLHQFSTNTSKEEKHPMALSAISSREWKNKKCIYS